MGVWGFRLFRGETWESKEKHEFAPNEFLPLQRQAKPEKEDQLRPEPQQLSLGTEVRFPGTWIKTGAPFVLEGV